MSPLPSCPACGSTVPTPIGRSRSRVAVFDDRSLAQCPACGLVLLANPPDPDAVVQLNAQYWSVAQTANRYADLVHKAQMRSRVEYLERHLGTLEGKRILDVGAGFGMLGNVLRERGRRVAFYAVEADPSCEAALLRHGSLAVWRDLQQCRERDFQLIVLSHVLEHVGAPGEFLAAVRRRLAPDGHLFIEVPNQDHRHKVDFGTHLLSFAPGVLAALVNSIAGLAVTDIQCVGRPLDILIAARDGAPPGGRGLREVARRLLPGPLWRVASDLADRGRAARASLDSIEQELQLSTYGPDRQWIRCIAERSPRDDRAASAAAQS
jgi:SAM-dependent methyltransferase